MFKERINFEKLLSLLQGSSWAFAIVGGAYSFFIFSPFGLLIGLLVGFFIFLIGFFFVIIIEIAHIQIEKLEEIKKHTNLLEKIAKATGEDEKILHH